MPIDIAPVPRGLAGADAVLTPEALAFVADLHARFDRRRRALLAAREERQRAFVTGALPDFRADGAEVRAADRRVAPAPADLADRRVEIAGRTGAAQAVVLDDRWRPWPPTRG
jgi:malate synthase